MNIIIRSFKTYAQARKTVSSYELCCYYFELGCTMTASLANSTVPSFLIIASECNNFHDPTLSMYHKKLLNFIEIIISVTTYVRVLVTWSAFFNYVSISHLI